MTAPAFPFGWRPRRRPLAAIAAVARGAPAVALGRRLLEEGEAAARFAGVGAPGWLFIAGPDLPWVEGIGYLGSDPGAPSLYLPTLLEPVWPLDLLTAALLRRGLALPCAVLPGEEGDWGLGPGLRRGDDRGGGAFSSDLHDRSFSKNDPDWQSGSSGKHRPTVTPAEAGAQSPSGSGEGVRLPILLSIAAARSLNLDLLIAWLAEQTG